MQNQLVQGRFLLKKMQGKGGWTYAELPELKNQKTNPFGWLRVRGKIDDYELKGFHLMPFGNGNLFLSVKAEIRKKINKKEGDYVQIELFLDNLPTDIPEELKQCLEMEAGVHEQFLLLNEGEKKRYVEHIYSAKSEETKAKRILDMIEKIQNRI